MKIPFIDYRSALAYNHDVFSIEHGDLLKVFDAIDGNFRLLVELPRTGRDRNRKTHVSLIPFMLLLHRQADSALMLTAPIYMLQVFDRVISSQNVDTLLFLTIIAAVSYLALSKFTSGV